MKRLIVLASGSGSNLQALIDAPDPSWRIALVVSNKPSGALRRAEASRIPALYLPLASRADASARERYDRQLAAIVEQFSPDLIVLAGWMLILSSAFLDRFPDRVINTHPALLPDDGGLVVACSAGAVPALRGAHAVRDALAVGLPVTGATVHFVTEQYDTGPVIAREETPILSGDTESSLHERIKLIEHRLLPLAAARVLASMDETGNCEAGVGERHE